MFGFVPINREMFRELMQYLPPRLQTNARSLWPHYLAIARWSDEKDPGPDGRILRRGQFYYGHDAMSQMTGLTVRNLRSLHRALVKAGEIHLDTNGRGTVVTITCYDHHCATGGSGFIRIEREHFLNLMGGFNRALRAKARALWIHYLMEARYQDDTRPGSDGKLLKEGQFLATYESIQDAIKITIQTQRSVHKILESLGELTRQVTADGTVITLNNYGKYGELTEAGNTQNNIEVTENQQPANSQTTPVRRCNKTTERFHRLKTPPERHIVATQLVTYFLTSP